MEKYYIKTLAVSLCLFLLSMTGTVRASSEAVTEYGGSIYRSTIPEQWASPVYDVERTEGTVILQMGYHIYPLPGVGFAVSGRDAGVFGTEREPLSGLVYDQIVPISDRLYAVRQGERYGDGVSGSVGSGQYLICGVPGWQL